MLILRQEGSYVMLILHKGDSHKMLIPRYIQITSCCTMNITCVTLLLHNANSMHKVLIV